MNDVVCTPLVTAYVTLIEQVYERWNPQKCGKAMDLMLKYQGEEPEVFDRLTKKYVFCQKKKEWKPLIVAMYQQFHPAKLHSVDNIIDKYQQVPAKLYRALCNKYLPSLTLEQAQKVRLTSKFATPDVNDRDIEERLAKLGAPIAEGCNADKNAAGPYASSSSRSAPGNANQPSDSESLGSDSEMEENAEDYSRLSDSESAHSGVEYVSDESQSVPGQTVSEGVWDKELQSFMSEIAPVVEAESRREKQACVLGTDTESKRCSESPGTKPAESPDKTEVKRPAESLDKTEVKGPSAPAKQVEVQRPVASPDKTREVKNHAASPNKREVKKRAVSPFKIREVKRRAISPFKIREVKVPRLKPVSVQPKNQGMQPASKDQACKFPRGSSTLGGSNDLPSTTRVDRRDASSPKCIQRPQRPPMLNGFVILRIVLELGLAHTEKRKLCLPKAITVDEVMQFFNGVARDYRGAEIRKRRVSEILSPTDTHLWITDQ